MGRCSLVVSVTWSAVYSKVNILGVLTSGYIINAIVSSLSLFIASYLKSMMLGRKLQSKLIRCIVWNLKNVANSHRSPLFHSCLYECMRTIMCTTLAVWQALCVRQWIPGGGCLGGTLKPLSPQRAPGLTLPAGGGTSPIKAVHCDKAISFPSASL